MAAALALTSLAPAPERAEFDYRESHDGRVVARVTAVARPDRLCVEIRASAPGLEPPRGYEGIGGENFQTARHLGDGRLSARQGSAWVASRRRFALRAYDAAGRRLVEGGVTEPLADVVRWEAPLAGAAPPAQIEASQDPDLARLIEALGHESPAARDAATAAILTRGPAALAELERFRDEEARFGAAEAMTHLAATPAPLLEERLADRGESLRVRQMAAVALGRRRRAEPLEAAYAGAPPELRLTIGSAAVEAAGDKAGGLLRRLLAVEKEDAVRLHLLDLIERLRG
jgi:hypothetical protein